MLAPSSEQLSENTRWILQAVMRQPNVQDTTRVNAKPIKRSVSKSIFWLLYEIVRPFVKPAARRFRGFLNQPLLAELALIRRELIVHRTGTAFHLSQLDGSLQR